MEEQKDLQKAAIERLQLELVERGVQKTALSETERIAKAFANHIRDPSNPEPPSFPGIPGDVESMDKYFLVLEYMQSIGAKMTSSVLKYESQHPDLVLNREELARKYHLRSYDTTPLLIQMLDQQKCE